MGHEEEKATLLTYTNLFPPSHRMSAVAREWCAEVENRTKGRIRFTYLSSGNLISPDRFCDSVVKGVVDIAMVSQHQQIEDRFPLTEGLYLPLGVKSARQATTLVNAWYERFHPREYDDVRVLYLYGSGPARFATLKPFSSIHDLEGLKVRCAGDTAGIVKAMGATPILVPLAGSHEALQKGVCDGSLLPVESLKGWKLGDFIRGVQMNDGVAYVSAFAVVINKEKWASLSPDVQRTVEEVSSEWAAKTAQAWDETDREGIDYGVSKGMKVFRISKEETAISVERMEPVLEEYVRSTEKLGLPGKESLKFCQDWLKANPDF